MSDRERIQLGQGFHAEPGKTPGHLHDVYTTAGQLGGNERVHVGELAKSAVEAWAFAERKAAAGHRR